MSFGEPPTRPMPARFTVPSPPQSLIKVRAGLAFFALVLGICGMWVLVPELLALQTAGLPRERNGGLALREAEDRVGWAAALAGIRGDLWARSSFTQSDILWLDRTNAASTAKTARINRARSDAERAVLLAPINGEAWLFLAKLPGVSSNPDPRVAAFLQMSFFTAPNDLSLAPMRLERAANTDALQDRDVQEFAKFDIRKILTEQPRLKPAIVAAYRGALPQNQALFESLVNDVDSAFVPS